MKAFYLAYGSNLHPVRLHQRIGAASLEGRVELPGYRLVFQKRGRDGSGKCNLRLTDAPGDRVFAVVYSLAPQQVILLDHFEGAGYRQKHLMAEVCGQARRVFTYIAPDQHCDPLLRPFGWYRELVLCGALYHRFPSSYLELLQQVPFIEDKDPVRREANRLLLARMRSR
jgi:hypothetical protein